MLILSQSDVDRILSIDRCIPVMEAALASLANGDALLPLRTVILVPNTTDAFAAMPGYLQYHGQRVVGAKIITVYPGNHSTAFDSHQGAVLVFHPVNGSLAAILDATAITTTRTAAVSAVATKLLARDDASTLAIIGAGVQAHAHLRAMCAVRAIRRVRVWSRTPANAEQVAAVARDALGLEAAVSSSGEQAVRGADIVCATTSAREPVVFGEWLSPGTHVNAIGASQRTAREIDTATVVRSRLYVDRRESALKEPGDILVPLDEGDIGPEHIVGEIGELLIGRAQGRRSRDEITLFKSLGLAIEDLAASMYVYEEARKSGIGIEVALGGARVAAH